MLGGSAVKLSPALDGKADQVVKAVREHWLERGVAKRIKSLDEPGKRSVYWVKWLDSKAASHSSTGSTLAERTYRFCR